MVDEKLISRLIQECERENDVDKRIVILEKINEMLPEFARLRFPSLITNDYVDVAIGKIEAIVRMLLHTQQYSMSSDSGKSNIVKMYQDSSIKRDFLDASIIVCNTADIDISANYHYRLSEVCKLMLAMGYRVLKCSSYSDCIQQFAKMTYAGDKVSLILLCGRPDDRRIEATARKLNELSKTRIILLADELHSVQRDAAKDKPYINKSINIADLSLDMNTLRMALWLDAGQVGNAACD